VREADASVAPPLGGSPGKPGSGFGDIFKTVNPKIYDLGIVDTAPHTLIMEARMNFTNPTNYSASIPYFAIHVLTNDTITSVVEVTNATVVGGNNTGMTARIKWAPFLLGGEKSAKVGREWLSQYISGRNTTMTFRMFPGSIPYQPGLGRLFSKYPITIQTPRLLGDDPKDGDGDGDDGGDGDEKPKTGFIQSATIHLFSSTAVFAMRSPFAHTTMFMEAINATAIYNHTDVIGTINYSYPFAIPPGVSESPRLPVEWDSSKFGYERLKEAIGGRLRVGAYAEVDCRIGRWRQNVWFEGQGIGANVRL
jgi:hypothetical protein